MKKRVTRLVLLPHTHWGREWYEPSVIFQEQLVAMPDGVLSQSDEEPAAGGEMSVIDEHYRLSDVLGDRDE